MFFRGRQDGRLFQTINRVSAIEVVKGDKGNLGEVLLTFIWLLVPVTSMPDKRVIHNFKDGRQLMSTHEPDLFILYAPKTQKG